MDRETIRQLLERIKPLASDAYSAHSHATDEYHRGEYWGQYLAYSLVVDLLEAYLG